MKLSELKTGESAVIVKVSGHGGFRKRVIEMGFIKGKKVDVLLNAPLQDPVKYKIMGYEVSLRHSEAELIEVMSKEEAKRQAALQQEEPQTAVVVDSQADDEQPITDKQLQEAAEQRHHIINVALVGNPNCGKTSLFNFASGAHERVGNYSGVTVDAKEGQANFEGYQFNLVDLPGTYSLSAYSPEELYVRKQIIEKTPDIIINVIDASNLERNLYLTTQLIDMNQRMVVALNMYDELEKTGDKLDHGQLSALFGVPMVPTSSRSGYGLRQLFETVIAVYESQGRDETLARHIHINHGVELEQSIDRIKRVFQQNQSLRSRYSTRWLAIKFLEGDAEAGKLVEKLPQHDELVAVRFEETKRLTHELHETPESALTDAKYGFVQGALRETYKPQAVQPGRTLTERIDRIVTHRLLGFPLFFVTLFVVFYATFQLGAYPMEWIEWLVGKLSEFVTLCVPEGMWRDMLVDGALGGVGAVIVFLPNILILYLFISLLEDSGYMARAAFIMDRPMHRIGLHGKSFIPLVMGFGCNVPAVMATRTVENPRSRLVTMLVVPFMSCSARIPVYVVLVSAFFPAYGAWVMLALYALGILVAMLMARIWGRVLSGNMPDLPFVMELPPYRLPSSKSVLRHTWEKGRQYLRKMGGIILLFSIVIWALGYFPRDAADSEATQPAAGGQVAEASSEGSWMERMGRTVSPVFAPMHFDWRMSVGILSGVGAKELVVSTLAVMYATSDSDDEEATEAGLVEAVRSHTEPAAALAYLVFVLLYFPCIATLVAIKNEGGGWRWAILAACYTTAVGYLAAWLTYLIFA